MTDAIDHGLPAARGAGVGQAYGLARRLLVVALKNGVEWFLANPNAWKRVVRFVDEAELAIVQQIFAARPPAVRAGYPLPNATMPMLAVVLAAERETDAFVGDVLEEPAELDEFPGSPRGIVEGSIFEADFRIQVWSDHPDVCEYLYEWAKYVVRGHEEWLIAQGLIEPGVRGGAELQPDPRFMPEQLFLREVQVSVRGISEGVRPMPTPPRELLVAFSHLTVKGRQGGLHVTGGGGG